MKVNKQTGEILQGSPELQTFLNYKGPTFPNIPNISFTQPDMCMSLEDLLHNHTLGLEVPFYPGTFTEDEFLPTNLDPSEYAELLEAQNQHIQSLIEKRNLEELQAENERMAIVKSEQNGGALEGVAKAKREQTTTSTD